MDYFDYKTDTQLGDFDVEEFLEESQQAEQKRLEDELERIDQQLEKRDRIHEETINELESKLDWYIDRLEKLYKQMQGKLGKREEVKTRIKEFYREIRREKREHWQDRQELEQERREILRGIEELESDRGLTEIL